MKRLVSIFLCLVLVFSFGVTSFAAYEPLAGDHNNTLDALNNIDYYIYWIFRDFTVDLTSIQDWLSDIWQKLAGDISFELTQIRGNTSNLSSIDTWLSKIWQSVAGDDIAFKLTHIRADISSLVEVLADPDDVALKDSQKNNQEAIQENFFTPGSDTSVDVGKISNVASISSDFFSAFDTSKVVGNSNPLELIGTGSDFSRWFSSENGQAMDPDFGIGSGGGDSDVPAPPSGPVYQGSNVLPYAVSNLVTGIIYNGKGFKNYSAFGEEPFPENDVYSEFYSTTGYIEVSAGDTLYIVNMDFSDALLYMYYGSVSTMGIKHFYGLEFNDFMASIHVDENGVFSYSFDSDPQTESLLAVRFQSALISPATYITINEYPLANVEPPEEPEPDLPSVKNWLPLATSTLGGSTIYNGIGWKSNTRLNSSNTEVSSNGMCLTGYIPVVPGDVLYTYNFSYSNAPATCYFYKYSN